MPPSRQVTTIQLPFPCNTYACTIPSRLQAHRNILLIFIYYRNYLAATYHPCCCKRLFANAHPMRMAQLFPATSAQNHCYSTNCPISLVTIQVLSILHHRYVLTRCIIPQYFQCTILDSPILCIKLSTQHHFCTNPVFSHQYPYQRGIVCNLPAHAFTVAAHD